MAPPRSKRAGPGPKTILAQLLVDTDQPADTASPLVGRVGVAYRPDAGGATFGLAYGLLDPLPIEAVAGGAALLLTQGALNRQPQGTVDRHAAVLAEASGSAGALNSFLISFPFSATGSISAAATDCLDELFVVLGSDARGPERWAGRVRPLSTPTFELASWQASDRLAYGAGLVCRVFPAHQTNPSPTTIIDPGLRHRTPPLEEALQSQLRRIAHRSTRLEAIDEFSKTLSALLSQIDSLPDQARVAVARTCRELVSRLAEADLPSEERRTLTAEQAARRLGRSQQLVGLLARRGEIGTMVGRRYLFSPAEIERLRLNPPPRGRPKS